MNYERSETVQSGFEFVSGFGLGLGFCGSRIEIVVLFTSLSTSV